MKKWICSVCGHVHEGVAPPELCPVCKVTSSHFHLPGEEPAVHVDDPEVAKLRKVIEGVAPATPKPVRKWICPVCGYVHEGTTPPELCPVCKVVGSQFRLPGEELKIVQEDPEITKLRKAIEGTGPVAAKPVRKWICPVCGYVHEGSTPPELCPVCKIVGSQFRLPGEELKAAQEDPEITKLRKAIEGTEPAAAKPVRKWICPVCGYVHEGATPPELCPVCKIVGSQFRLPGEELKAAQEDPEITKLRKVIEGAEPMAAKPVRKWICPVCGYVHEGATPPELCPICKVTASKFNAVD